MCGTDIPYGGTRVLRVVLKQGIVLRIFYGVCGGSDDNHAARALDTGERCPRQRERERQRERDTHTDTHRRTQTQAEVGARREREREKER
eukprot:3791670-Rhodomonas_salina.1